jgi:hypothetical protein
VTVKVSWSWRDWTIVLGKVARSYQFVVFGPIAVAWTSKERF